MNKEKRASFFLLQLENATLVRQAKKEYV